VRLWRGLLRESGGRAAALENGQGGDTTEDTPRSFAARAARFARRAGAVGRTWTKALEAVPRCASASQHFCQALDHDRFDRAAGAGVGGLRWVAHVKNEGGLPVCAAGQVVEDGGAGGRLIVEAFVVDHFH
jgi:hypothetical protein